MTRAINTLRLDAPTHAHATPEFAHEVQVALTDILHEHHFLPVGCGPSPYDVVLKTEEQRLVFLIGSMGSNHTTRIALSIQPLKTLLRDYAIICDSYYTAIKTHDTRKLEAIDMARRGLHNEAAENLREMLKSKIDVDTNTARRLFTFLAVLYSV